MKKWIYTALMMVGASSLSIRAQEEAPKSELRQLEERTSNIEGKLTKLEKLKVSGYIQTQYQHGEEAASLKVGAANEKTSIEDGGAFDRFGIRRGRIKFTYTEGIASGVFQLDITEKGVGIKDAYLDIKDPWMKRCGIKAGVFDRPFGYEISYSSSKRESPERSSIFQTLFPDERDLGVALVLTPKKESPFSFLKLTAGIFSGNGIKQDTKSLRDFIGHVSASKTIGSSAKWGTGFSYYLGGVYQGDKRVCEMSGKTFVVDSSASNLGEYAKRQYFGVDGQFEVESPLGTTKLTAEYLWGQQPGTEGSSKSPNGTLGTQTTFIRNFSGYYVMLVQSIGTTPFSLVGKYDYYDANTEVSGNEVGAADSKTGKADFAKSTVGAGAIWRINNALKLTAYYDFNKNEKSDNVKGYDADRKDDVFTLRLQYKF
ncbi:MAG: porin [Paludibacteraceae bacterium]